MVQFAATKTTASSAADAQNAPLRNLPAFNVAFAPMAMAVLLRAQEQINATGNGAGRMQSILEIDRLIDQIADASTPPARVSASEGFALRRLFGARQQLHDVHA